MPAREGTAVNAALLLFLLLFLLLVERTRQ
jgi:hypothetical protein